MTEWTIVTVCKTVARSGYAGSNPAPSTKLLSKMAGILCLRIGEKLQVRYCGVLFQQPIGIVSETICGFAKQIEDPNLHADVAQWQSVPLVRERSWVRFPSSALVRQAHHSREADET